MIYLHNLSIRVLCCTAPCLGLFYPLVAAADDQPQRKPALTALSREVEFVPKSHGDGIEASLWLGGESGDAWFELKSNRFRPAASAIKT